MEYESHSVPSHIFQRKNSTKLHPSSEVTWLLPYTNLQPKSRQFRLIMFLRFGSGFKKRRRMCCSLAPVVHRSRGLSSNQWTNSPARRSAVTRASIAFTQRTLSATTTGTVPRRKQRRCRLGHCGSGNMKQWSTNDRNLYTSSSGSLPPKELTGKCDKQINLIHLMIVASRMRKVTSNILIVL